MRAIQSDKTADACRFSQYGISAASPPLAQHSAARLRLQAREAVAGDGCQVILMGQPTGP